jgi:HSP20 family protein
MDRLLTGFLGQPLDGFRPSASRGQPALNMWEQGDQVVVEMEVPGLKEDQLDLAVSGGELSIRIDRPEVVEEGVTYHRRERPVGTFARTVRLPADIDAEKVEARLNDGVLRIILPRAESAKPRKIEVAQA